MDSRTGHKVSASLEHLAAWLRSIGVDIQVRIKKKRVKKGKKYPNGVQAEEDRDFLEIRFEYDFETEVNENLIFTLLQKTIKSHDELTVTLDPALRKKRYWAYVVRDK